MRHVSLLMFKDCKPESMTATVELTRDPGSEVVAGCTTRYRLAHILLVEATMPLDWGYHTFNYTDAS